MRQSARRRGTGPGGEPAPGGEPSPGGELGPGGDPARLVCAGQGRIAGSGCRPARWARDRGCAGARGHARRSGERTELPVELRVVAASREVGPGAIVLVWRDLGLEHAK